MKRIVAIGGGSGLSTLLRGLRDYPLDITAIVTMTDDGASTGRLRKDLKILPPGDIRKCIAALSEDESLLVDLFQYRFNRGIGLSGHSLGNLLISAMKEITGSFESGIQAISSLLSINGSVLPASLADVHLAATFSDDKVIVGESKITKYGYKHRIKNLRLTKSIKANPRAVKAINEADLILIGPGSLYTSLLPVFLIPEIKKAFSEAKGKKVYISNVSTERGETEGFSVEDHIKTLSKYGVVPNLTLANNKYFPDKSGDGYVTPVRSDGDGKNIVFFDLVDSDHPLYHDSAKLKDAVWQLLYNAKKMKPKA